METNPQNGQRGTAGGRIEVLRADRLVPLLTSSEAAIPREQPWRGLLLEQHLVRPGEIPEHEHPDVCLHLQVSGHADFEWWSEGRNALEKTAPGSMILIPPGTRDRLRWTGRSERLIVSLHSEWFRSLAAKMGSPKLPDLRTRWALNDNLLQQLVAEMGQQAQAQWPLGSLYADLLAMGLGTQLLRRHAEQPLNLEETKGGLPMPRLRLALEYMTENLSRDLKLDEVAAELQLNTFHFAHEFRNSTGQTPYQYLLDQRMRRAMQLLRTTNWSMQYIAGEAGFGSATNFVRAFRQRLGVTPGSWRKSA